MSEAEDTLKLQALEYEKKYWMNKELAAYFEHQYWRLKHDNLTKGVD